MKNPIAALLFMLCFSTDVIAQDESVFNRINGARVRDNIYIKWDTIGKNFAYNLNYFQKNNDWHSFDDPLIFNVRNQFKNNFKVFIEFYNPLRYTLKSSLKELDDPAFTTISDFVSKLPTSGALGSSLNSTTVPLAAKSGFLSFKEISGCSFTPFKGNVLIPEWILEFQNNIIKLNKSKETCNDYNKIVDKINKLNAVGNYLYGAFELVGGESPKTLSGWIKSTTTDLYNCQNDFQDFKNKLEDADNIYKDLDALSKSNKASLEAVAELLSEFDEIEKLFISEVSDRDAILQATEAVNLSYAAKDKAETNFNDATAIVKKAGKSPGNEIIEKQNKAKEEFQNAATKLALDKLNLDKLKTNTDSGLDVEPFKLFSEAVSKRLLINTKDKFDSNELIIKKFGELLKKSREHVDGFTEVCTACGKENFRRDFDIKIDWKSKKMKEFEYSTTEKDLDGSEDEKSTEKGTFTVAKKLFLYPFISTGLFYSGLTYPNYAIEKDASGLNKVAKVKDTKVYMRPALYLNLLIADLEPVYPFIQLGISTGDNDVIFPVGAGISLGTSFSISGGILLGTRKELNKLDVGDVESASLKIDDAVLKNDLIDKGFISGYFSVHYNLGKK